MGNLKQGYLPTLDGWRAIAILAVILDHATASLQQDHPRFFTLTRVGPNGVSLFFAISGFLICSRLLEEEQMCGRISLKGFYIRRGCRILPAAMTYLAVIGILGLAGVITVTPWEWWSSVLFFRNYLPPLWIHQYWGGYTIHYWSLAVEEHFYLLWPLVLVLAGKSRAKYIAASAAVGIAVWRWWDFRHQWFAHHVPGLLFSSRTDVRLDALLLGSLAALLLQSTEWRVRFARNFRTPVWLFCIFVYCSIQIFSHKHSYTFWESALLPLIVVGTVVRPNTWAGKFLEHPVARWIGRLSYSLYLWQQFFCVKELPDPFAKIQTFPWNIGILVLVATLSYRFVERPMVRLGHRLAPPPTPGRDDIPSIPSLPSAIPG
jgi:peptidoglycan/LPS O-acetylase OafA/YrhL